MLAFNNLKLLQKQLDQEIQSAVDRVLQSGWYILGPEVEAFEADFAKYHGLPHAVSVANGTDAIELALRGAGIGPGDEVITVPHTAVATVCAIERTGAKPLLVDIDPHTYTMSPEAAEAAITPRTKAIVPVHLYGHPAKIDVLRALADRHRLFLMEDCAQAHGARYQNRLVGTWGDAASFSFYPTKNLGAYGDGGAIVMRDPALATRVKRLRNYGQTDRYHHIERGMNSRLDEMQAAILGVKLTHLDKHNATRRQIAEWYAAHVPGLAMPKAVGDVYHVFHLYVARHPRRDWLRDEFKKRGVDTQIHYPVPVHRQPAYADLGYPEGSLPVVEQIVREIISLPMYVGLTEVDIRLVGDAMGSILAKEGDSWTNDTTTASAARAA